MNAKRTLNAKQWMSQNSIWVVLIFMAALMSILSMILGKKPSGVIRATRWKTP